MDKNTFVEVVGSSTVYQGIWKESHPPVHLVGGRQISVWAVELEEPANLPQPLSPQSKTNKQTMESADLVRYPQTREILQKSRLPGVEIPTCHWSKKQKKILFGHSGDGIRNFPSVTLPQGNTAQG